MAIKQLCKADKIKNNEKESRRKTRKKKSQRKLAAWASELIKINYDNQNDKLEIHFIKDTKETIFWINLI